MPDISIEIVIPEQHQARMKAAIEWLVNNRGGVSTEGVSPDPETGKLTNAETIKMFRRITYSNWRKLVLRTEKQIAESQAGQDNIFDPGTIP